ncbi:hypothetical protein EB077_13275, partial [bacterium]|nr:hypothetical protein [bacterium]
NVGTIPAIKVGKVYSIPNSTTIVVDTRLTSIDQVKINQGLAYIGTGLITVKFPDHSFNSIVSITNYINAGQLLVQTLLPHNYKVGDKVRLNGTNSVPVVDGGYTVQVVPSNDTFVILHASLASPSTTGGLLYNNNFYLYGATSVGEIPVTSLNGLQFTVRDIIDKDTFTFYNNYSQATKEETDGGNNVFISSLVHGFSGIQTNTKNDLLNRSINLQGENYAFLCCPQLSTMMNTGNVKDIFARITLDQSPGNMVFSYLSNPKEFTTVPLDTLNDLEFSIVNYDGSYYEFNDLDYSFTLEIVEQIDVTNSFNVSSKRGIVIH